MVTTATISPAAISATTNTLPAKAKKCSCIIKNNNKYNNSFYINNNNYNITKNTLNSNYAKYQQRLQQQPIQQQHSKRRHDCSPPQHFVHKNQITKNLSMIIFCIFLILPLEINCSAYAAAVYANVDFHSNPTFEPICNLQEEHFIESEGKESSLILEFNNAILPISTSTTLLKEKQQQPTAYPQLHQLHPQTSKHLKPKSCTRILSAPPNYGFIIRLILPKIRTSNYHHSSVLGSSLTSGTHAGTSDVHDKEPMDLKSSINKLQMLNTEEDLKKALGRSCPLSIFSSHDPHTPQWRVDPCQLEDTAPEMEDPVRLFHGRVRIVWDHRNHTLNSKLMVTVLGKGDQCRSEKKHQCLRIGDEPILCISKDLICDGIRHCPYSNEYDSDEDYSMCWKRSRLGEPINPAMESEIEHLALEVFRNLFAFDVPSWSKATSKPKTVQTTEGRPKESVQNSTTLHKISPSKNETVESGDEMEVNNGTLAIGKAANATELSNGHHHRRNSTRLGLNSDLSKYGPWGYLMLGMLLCGGALLICGLWASASQHAANNERESALQSANAAALSADNHSTGTAPPNYEELDPPPAYSVLFPNQKAASSNTLNSLDIGASAAIAAAVAQNLSQQSQLSPSAAPSSRSTVRTLNERESAGSSSTQSPSADNDNRL